MPVTPAFSSVLFQRSTARWQSLTYSSRRTSFIALRSGTVCCTSLPLSGTSSVYVWPSALCSKSASSRKRPLRPAAKKSAALDETSPPKRSTESVNQRLQYFCSRESETAPSLAGSLPCAINSAQRWTTRSTPISPTKRWCASSVSMNRVVRASGSNPDCASAASWYLPSRSVNIAKKKNDSQSSMGSLNAFRMRGLSLEPERRLSSSSASSRPSRPKWRCKR